MIDQYPFHVMAVSYQPENVGGLIVFPMSGDVMTFQYGKICQWQKTILLDPPYFISQEREIVGKPTFVEIDDHIGTSRNFTHVTNIRKRILWINGRMVVFVV